MKKGGTFVMFLLLAIFSYSFTGSEHEIFLCSIYEKEDYNHYTYYIMLDTLNSKINVYKDSYGEISHDYSLKICPDSSIIFYRETEGYIRLNIKSGLIRSRTYEDGYVENLLYDKENHLISIGNMTNFSSFIWKDDSLVQFKVDVKVRGDSLRKFVRSYIVPTSPLCHATKSPELFCRVYKHYRFNEILLSMLGLYGEWPLSPDSYSIKEEDFGVNSSHYIRDTKVSNIYTKGGILLETCSFYKVYGVIHRFDWNIDNMNRIFNYRNIEQNHWGASDHF
jgi:hypothetical protein